MVNIDAAQFIWLTIAGIGAPAMLGITLMGVWYADKYRKLQHEIDVLRDEVQKKSGEIEALRRTLIELTAKPVEVQLVPSGG